MGRIVFAIATALVAPACLGSTGSELVTFEASAAGVPDVVAGRPFVNGRGYVVTLERAWLRVGAVFLSRTAPVSGGQTRECYASGGYVGEVLSGLDVDLLSSAPQRFAELGRGTRDRARSCEVWLTGDRVDAENDKTVILDAKGTAIRGGEVIPFEAKLTIGKNRVPQNDDPTRPGATPLCSLRIVSPIACDVAPDTTGALRLSIDARNVFANVEFADLPPAEGVRKFLDGSEDQPSLNVFSGMRAAGGTYAVTWIR